MRTLFLPFFILRLGLVLLPFFVQLLWLVVSPFLGLLVLLMVVFLYALLFARHVANIRFWQENPPLPSSLTFSPFSSQLQQKIVTNSPHRLFYRDDPTLAAKQAELTTWLKQAPTHRDLLINAGILAEVNPALSPTPGSSASAYQQARYSDPNSPLLAE